VEEGGDCTLAGGAGTTVAESSACQSKGIAVAEPQSEEESKLKKRKLGKHETYMNFGLEAAKSKSN